MTKARAEERALRKGQRWQCADSQLQVKVKNKETSGEDEDAHTADHEDDRANKGKHRFRSRSCARQENIDATNG